MVLFLSVLPLTITFICKNKRVIIYNEVTALKFEDIKTYYQITLEKKIQHVSNNKQTNNTTTTTTKQQQQQQYLLKQNSVAPVTHNRPSKILLPMHPSAMRHMHQTVFFSSS